MSAGIHRLLGAALTAALLGGPAPAAAHGGVVLEDDLCVIKVGYLEGHFKIYLPRARGHTEYCEDLPVAGETLFVMEYLHEGLARAPVELRVVRNTTGLGRFARAADLEGLDLEPITVFHRAPAVDPDVFTAVHQFTEPGEYVGIVTAHPDGATRPYTAVFPFRVGFTGLGHWPWFMLFVLFLIGNLWFVRRRLAS
ncbi:MAG TPA: hypothetical protein VF210_02770 [Pseudomonadales bacterium]